MELQLGQQFKQKKETTLRRVQYAIYFNEFLGSALCYFVFNIFAEPLTDQNLQPNHLLNALLQGLASASASMFCGDLSNMGYFNPAIVVGVLVQQYDHELSKFSKGLVGILENIKFAGVTIAFQIMGTIAGLLLWKVAIYTTPSDELIGISLMCPSLNIGSLKFEPISKS